MLLVFTSALWSLMDRLPLTAGWGSETASWQLMGLAWLERTTRGEALTAGMLLPTAVGWMSDDTSKVVLLLTILFSVSFLQPIDYSDRLVRAQKVMSRYHHLISAELHVTRLPSFSLLLPPCSAVDLIRLGGGRLRFLVAKSDPEVSEKISASSCWPPSHPQDCKERTMGPTDVHSYGTHRQMYLHYWNMNASLSSAQRWALEQEGPSYTPPVPFKLNNCAHVVDRTWDQLGHQRNLPWWKSCINIQCLGLYAVWFSKHSRFSSVSSWSTSDFFPPRISIYFDLYFRM